MLKQFSRSLVNLYFARSEAEKGLLLSCFFGLSLVCFRVVYTGQIHFVWLLWNLFLALVPYLLTRTAMRQLQWIESNIRFFLLFFTWLFFIPNSFYIITDLFHLEDQKVMPRWYDLALLFSFAWNGFFLGISSLRQMQTILQCKWPQVKEWQFFYPVMVLNALGVYIGRYLRYNSWDVITNPFDLTSDVLSLLVHPLRNRLDLSMIVCYAVLLSVLCIAIKRMAKALS